MPIPILIEGVDTEEMKNVIKRSDGRFMIRVQVNNQRITKYAKNERAAARIKRELKQQLKKENPVKVKDHRKLADWLDFWLENYKKPFIKPKSAKLIESVIKEIKNYFKDIELAKLTSHTIQKFLNTFPVSRKKEFITLYFGAALKMAENTDIITKSPFRAVVKDKKINNIREPFNYIEQSRILQKIKGTDIEPVILFYLATGIRKNELNTINLMDDIDIEHNLLKVKNEKKRTIKQTYRYVDITPKLIEIVKNNQKSFKLTTNQIYRRFKAVLEDLHIKGSTHSLRHTFTTNHFYLGTPTKLVSEWLGHEKIELTQNIYTHIDRTITKDMILKLYDDLYFKTA